MPAAEQNPPAQMSGQPATGAVAETRQIETPRLELDELLHQLVDRAQDVLATQGRLRALLRANGMVVGDLTLPVVLRRIVESACDLAQARYGALGVISSDGGALEEFVHVGVDQQTEARIGHLPAGKGLLGALIDDPRPIRLARISDDPRSVGFPPGHPPMRSFLGVPIRVRDVVFGNLYLTDREGGEFTAEDEELVVALAGTAGVAIENARLFEQAEHRQRWLQASTEVTRQLLSQEGEEPLQLIARKAREIADADVVMVVLPTSDSQQLMIEAASGEHADGLRASVYPIEDSLVGAALQNGRSVLIRDGDHDNPYSSRLPHATSLGPLMVLPLGETTPARGALVIGRSRGRHWFDEAHLNMATTFANHATVALELADARADQQRMVLLEDRDRIARDLHDHVIQRLFAAGLTTQSVASGLGPTGPAQRLARVVTDLDETIRQIRTSIFQLRGALGPQTGTVRERLLAVVAEVTPLLGFEPEVRFSGPIDAVVAEPLMEDVVAVLREALTNAARHAQASRVDVEVEASAAQLCLDVTDDGTGINETARQSGLANLRQRAERHGGSLTLASGVARNAEPIEGGTRLRWTIPLP